MTAAHSRLAPSSAHRWVVCPGSVQLEERYPELDESESAAEGTAAHFAGSEQLESRTVQLGQLAPNGIVLTDDMLAGAKVWIDAVGGPRPDLQVEQRVTMPRIHEQCFGTPDTWRWLDRDGVLHLWDFKYGFELVEAEGNWQCIAYVCGVLDLLGIDGRTDQDVWVEIHIVQPRAPHPLGRVRTWRVKACDLRIQFHKLREAAEEALGPRPRTVSGAHCLHCKAAPHCLTLHRSVMSAADYLGGSAPYELDAVAAGYELELLEHLSTLVKARLKGREADVEARIKRGEGVDGWTMETTSGRRVWKDVQEVLIMGDLLGVDLRQPVQAITPNQAENKVDASVIAAYSHKPTTGVKLARSTNSLAHRAFGVK